MSGRGVARMVVLAAGCFIVAVAVTVALVLFTNLEFHRAWSEVMAPW